MTVMQPLQQKLGREAQPPPENHETFGLLMSLALDGLLDAQEQARLDAHLRGCAACQEQWRLWRAIHATLLAAAPVAPPADFATRVVQRLGVQERRRRLGLGLTLGALAFIMWGVGSVGALMMLGLLIYNQVSSQVGWLMQALQGMAYIWTTLSIVGPALGAALLGLVETPTTAGAILVYLTLAALILVGWTRFLRNSLRPVEEEKWVLG